MANQGGDKPTKKEPTVTSRARRLIIAIACLAALTIAGPVSAAAEGGAITGSTATDSCFASSDGTCSGAATASPEGAFSASAELDSPDSPLSRSTRYSMALARYTIGFDLTEPTRQTDISVTLQVDQADASWTQALPELFGGAKSPSSGAKVLFQLFGHEAPDECGCGWFGQGAPNEVVVKAAAVGENAAVSDQTLIMTMTGNNPYGDNLLPAGHYEVLLRAYALTDLVGSGDWGTLHASVTGSIQDVTVSTPAETEPTSLTLTVSGTGSNRTLSAELSDASGAPIDGRTISFYSEGALLGTAQTENGIATLPVSGRYRGGSHVFTAEFAGDELYEGSSGTAQS